jgi:hypothetical protein
MRSINELLTGYSYGVVLYKVSHTLQPFSDLLRISVWVLIIPDSSTRALWQIPAETPSSKWRETWWEMVVNFADEIFLSYSTGFFTIL